MQSNVIKCCQILSNVIKNCLSRFIVASRRSILSPPLWLSLCILDDVCSYPEEYWQYFDQKYQKLLITLIKFPRMTFSIPSVFQCTGNFWREDRFNSLFTIFGSEIQKTFDQILNDDFFNPCVNVPATGITLNLCALTILRTLKIFIRNTITKSY